MLFGQDFLPERRGLNLRIRLSPFFNWSVAAAVAIVLVVSALYVTRNSDKVERLPDEDELCRIFSSIGYCYAAHLDDGPILFSVIPSSFPNCCIVERYNMEEESVNYRVKACTKSPAITINCRRYERTVQYGNAFIVDGQEISAEAETGGINND